MKPWIVYWKCRFPYHYQYALQQMAAVRRLFRTQISPSPRRRYQSKSLFVGRQNGDRFVVLVKNMGKN